MRFILGSALVVSATVLLSHGWFFENEARKALESSTLKGSQTMSTVEQSWPYTTVTSELRAGRLKLGTPADANASEEDLTDRIVAGAKLVLSSEPPYVQPNLASAVALVALLLALFLPRTRFRGLALLLLIFGAAALYPSYSDGIDQVQWARDHDFLVPVQANAPRIAASLLLLSGLCLGGESRHRSRRSED
jgi:hypothetical protein